MAGVGQELSKIIDERIPESIMKVLDTTKCGCGEYAEVLDAWGPDGCEQRKDKIAKRLAQKSDELGHIVRAIPKWIRTRKARQWLVLAIKISREGDAKESENERDNPEE